MTPIVAGQLARLTRPLEAERARVFAIAVYAEPGQCERRLPLRPRTASEQGFEGVACVDDAARAVVLYTRLWRERGLMSARGAAIRLLPFLGLMQDEDGRFCNFILDWSGRPNRLGPTSRPGGAPWQARALHALAAGVTLVGGGEWDERFRRALRWIDEACPYLDVRAVAVLAVLEHWRTTGASDSADRALAWSREIADHSSASILVNAAGVQPIHLWGHLQEAALATTGHALGLADLVDCARASAETLLLPAVNASFDSEHVLPFDVSCTVAGLAAVARATSNERYATAASHARQWFDGRNTAARPVYDARRGMVFDGIDHGVVSQNSGAESNIEGALALLT